MGGYDRGEGRLGAVAVREGVEPPREEMFRLTAINVAEAPNAT